MPRFEYRVESVKAINDRVVAIEMAPRGRAMRFSPGQFVFVQFFQRGISTEAHPFSVSSTPEDGRLRIVVKALGDYTSRLPALRRGAVARIEGPFGKFSHHNCPNRKQVWIAGGIGITPFLSMAGTLARLGLQRRFVLLGEQRGGGCFPRRAPGAGRGVGLPSRHPLLRGCAGLPHRSSSGRVER